MSIFVGQNRSRKGNETHNLLYFYYHCIILIIVFCLFISYYGFLFMLSDKENDFLYSKSMIEICFLPQQFLLNN